MKQQKKHSKNKQKIYSFFLDELFFCIFLASPYGIFSGDIYDEIQLLSSCPSKNSLDTSIFLFFAITHIPKIIVDPSKI